MMVMRSRDRWKRQLRFGLSRQISIRVPPVILPLILPLILPFSHSGIASDFFRPIFRLYIMITGHCTLVFHVHFSLLQLRSPWPGDHPYPFNCSDYWPCSPLSHAQVAVLNPTRQLVKVWTLWTLWLVTRDQLMTREWQTMRGRPLPHHQDIHLKNTHFFYIEHACDRLRR